MKAMLDLHVWCSSPGDSSAVECRIELCSQRETIELDSSVPIQARRGIGGRTKQRMHCSSLLQHVTDEDVSGPPAGQPVLQQASDHS